MGICTSKSSAAGFTAAEEACSRMKSTDKEICVTDKGKNKVVEQVPCVDPCGTQDATHKGDEDDQVIDWHSPHESPSPLEYESSMTLRPPSPPSQSFGHPAHESPSPLEYESSMTLRPPSPPSQSFGHPAHKSPSPLEYESSMTLRPPSPPSQLFGHPAHESPSPLEYNPSMTLRPPPPPLPSPSPFVFDTIGDIKWKFRGSDEDTYVPLHTFLDVDLFSVCPSVQDDQLSICSESDLFREEHWAALGLTSSTSASTASDHLAKEQMTILDATAVESPGTRIQILSKLSTVVPGAVVRRARVTRHADSASSHVKDPCAVQVTTYGSINHLNEARRSLQESMPAMVPHATMVPRSIMSGAIEPIKVNHLRTGYVLGADKGDCAASEVTPDAVADRLAHGVSFEITEALRAAEAMRKLV